MNTRYDADNVDLLFHDTVDVIQHEDDTNEFQIMVYGKTYYITNYDASYVSTSGPNFVMDLSLGSSVEVNSQKKGVWMSGTILKDNGDGTFDIQYYNPDASFNTPLGDSFTPTPIMDTNPANDNKGSKNYVPMPTLFATPLNAPSLFLDELYNQPVSTTAPPVPLQLPSRPSHSTNYDPAGYEISRTNGKITSIIERSVPLYDIRQLISIKYNNLSNFPTYNDPGYFKYNGGSTYVPSYSDSVYLSKTYNFLPKSAYAM
jgi:hypothetical protein